jgi:hypothetical protein
MAKFTSCYQICACACDGTVTADSKAEKRHVPPYLPTDRSITSSSKILFNSNEAHTAHPLGTESYEVMGKKEQQ